MKQYYEITTSMSFSKTVLVPVDSVKDAQEAVDLVDGLVETCDIQLLTSEADSVTILDRIVSMSDVEAQGFYDIYEGDFGQEQEM